MSPCRMSTEPGKAWQTLVQHPGRYEKTTAEISCAASSAPATQSTPNEESKNDTHPATT